MSSGDPRTQKNPTWYWEHVQKLHTDSSYFIHYLFLHLQLPLNPEADPELILVTLGTKQEYTLSTWMEFQLIMGHLKLGAIFLEVGVGDQRTQKNPTWHPEHVQKLPRDSNYFIQASWWTWSPLQEDWVQTWEWGGNPHGHREHVDTLELWGSNPTCCPPRCPDGTELLYQLAWARK